MEKCLPSPEGGGGVGIGMCHLGKKLSKWEEKKGGEMGKKRMKEDMILMPKRENPGKNGV
jgi:hypothetical protein